MSRNQHADKNTNASSRPPARRGPSGAWSRLKPAVIDPLEVYGLPSKGETKLHDHANQEAFYGKIVERYMKFCAGTGGRDGLEAAFASVSVEEKNPSLLSSKSSSQENLATAASSPSDIQSQLRPTGKDANPTAATTSSSTPSSSARPSAATDRSDTTTSTSHDLSAILLAMRKLREGILGARRRDAFAQRAYMFIIHASILSSHWEGYEPALRYLLSDLDGHPIPTATSMSKITSSNQTSSPPLLGGPERATFATYRVLDLACRQNELSEAIAVRNACRLHRERKLTVILEALLRDDWVRFWRARRAVDGYMRAIMDFAAPRMRVHALKCLGRGYLSADRAFVERAAEETWEALVVQGVGWQLLENGTVVIRKPKGK